MICSKIINRKDFLSLYYNSGIPDRFGGKQQNPEDRIGNHHKNCENSTGLCHSYDKENHPSIELQLPEDPYLKNYIWKKQCLAYAVWYLAEESNSYQLYQKHFEMVSF